MRCRPFTKNDHGQLVILLAVIIAMAIFVMSYIGVEISDMDSMVPNNRVNDIQVEYQRLVDNFGISLQLDLITEINTTTDTMMGDISTIQQCFNATSDDYNTFLLNQGKNFIATLYNTTYTYTDSDGYHYTTLVSIQLQSNTRTINDIHAYELILTPSLDVPLGG